MGSFIAFEESHSSAHTARVQACPSRHEQKWLEIGTMNEVALQVFLLRDLSSPMSADK